MIMRMFRGLRHRLGFQVWLLWFYNVLYRIELEFSDNVLEMK